MDHKVALRMEQKDRKNLVSNDQETAISTLEFYLREK